MTIRDQVITDTMARAIQADAARISTEFAWVIMRDQPDHPGKVIAHFATKHPSVDVLRADSLTETAVAPARPASLRAQPFNPVDVIEVWFSVL